MLSVGDFEFAFSFDYSMTVVVDVIESAWEWKWKGSEMSKVFFLHLRCLFNSIDVGGPCCAGSCDVFYEAIETFMASRVV